MGHRKNGSSDPLPAEAIWQKKSVETKAEEDEGKDIAAGRTAMAKTIS